MGRPCACFYSTTSPPPTDQDMSVQQLQELMNKSHGLSDSEKWDQCYKQHVTPWALDEPHHALLKLIRDDAIKSGNVLVPGCGLPGHDVIALASKTRHVVGLDISPVVIEACQSRA